MSLVEEAVSRRSVTSEIPPVPPTGSLRQNRDFWRLWRGQGAARVGEEQ